MIFNSKAMSMVELMVVVVIVALISGVSLISLESLVPLRLEAEGKMIVNDLCWAREMAVSRHDDFIVDFDFANEAYTIYKGSIAQSNLYKRRNLQIDLSAIIPGPNNITFTYPGGSSQTQQIDLSYRGRAAQINVYGETGYVELQ